MDFPGVISNKGGFLAKLPAWSSFQGYPELRKILSGGNIVSGCEHTGLLPTFC